jgi:cytoskeletal protein CcmA (bactofilin family)
MTWFKKSIDGDDVMMNSNSTVSRPEPRTPQQRAAETRSEPRPAESRPTESRPTELRPLEARVAESAHRASVLGPTLRFRGELSAQEDLIVQGSVEGSITHTQSLTIGAEGSMKGDIRARVIVVDGKVEGDLYATESVNIRAAAKVKGNVFAPRIGIADGALFQGQVEMQPSGAAVQEHSARLRQASMSATPLDGAAVDQMLSAGQG